MAKTDLRGYFDLQFRFADVLARRKPMPLARAIIWNTNLHRRFAYGNLSRQPPDPEFLALAERLAALDPASRLDLAVAAYAQRPEEGLPDNLFPFGCFRCEAPDERGHVRLHFGNRDSDDGLSPLDESKIARREAELADLTRFAVEHSATAIDGGSWLYNTGPYRRLFPRAFADSRTLLEGPRSIHGAGHWGQLLDFRSRVKPALRDEFLARLADLDAREPWRAFPLPVLMTTAPIAVFRERYGV